MFPLNIPFLETTQRSEPFNDIIKETLAIREGDMSKNLLENGQTIIINTNIYKNLYRSLKLVFRMLLAPIQ
jgi:hypothetical protein